MLLALQGTTDKPWLVGTGEKGYEIERVDMMVGQEKTETSEFRIIPK